MPRVAFSSNVTGPKFGRGLQMTREDWDCDDCGRRNKYYWAMCPSCGADRPISHDEEEE